MYQTTSPLLTEKHRRALKEDFDELAKSDRTRLRDRIISILQDFATVNEHLPADERAKLFKKALGWDLTRDIQDEDRQTVFMYGLSGIQEFIWTGLRQNDWTVEQHERLISESIRRGEQDAPPGIWLTDDENTEVSVAVDIDIERKHSPSTEKIIERYKQGHRLSESDAKQILKSIPRKEILELLTEYRELE